MLDELLTVIKTAVEIGQFIQKLNSRSDAITKFYGCDAFTIQTGGVCVSLFCRAGWPLNECDLQIDSSRLRRPNLDGST